MKGQPRSQDFLSSSLEGGRERILRTRLVQGDLSWPSLSMKKTQLLCKCVLELKAVLYFSADLYLITQTIRGNHDWNSRDRRGQMFFPFPAVAAAAPLLSCRFGEHHSITHLYGFLVVSIVANDISILTVYGNLTKMHHFPFWIYFVWNERSAPD